MKTRSKIRIPMPARYVINLALVVGFYFLLTGLISSGIITNYWTGILITVGINIILAVSLNIATGYLGQRRWVTRVSAVGATRAGFS